MTEEMELELRSQLITNALASYGAPSTNGNKTLDLQLRNNPEIYARDFGQVIMADQDLENPNIAIFNQVEDLLEQCARLLDRCLADKAAYDVLNAERFKTRLELGELLALQTVLDEQQRDASYWKFRSQDARNEGDVHADVLNERMHPAAGFPTLEQLYLWDTGIAISREAANVADAEDQGRWSLAKGDTAGRYSEHLASRVANQRRKELHDFRAVYHDKDSEYLRRKLEISKESLYLKLSESVASAGALNYDEIIRSLVGRSSDDFSEAYLKIEALKLGLLHIAKIDLPLDLQVSARPLDDAVGWVRRASNALGRFLLHDQRFVFRMSLKEKSGGDIKAFLQGQVTTFTVDDLAFPEFTRLTGLSAIAVGSASETYFPIELTIPEQPFSKGIGLSSVRCRLGRVTAPQPGIQPDIAGIPKVRNRRPFGRWTVTFAGSRNTPAPKDIFIDLHLVGQPTQP